VRKIAVAVFSLSLAACGDCGKPSGAPKDADVPEVYSIKVPGDAAAAMPMPSANTEAMLNPDNLPVYDGPTGSVEGNVYVTGDPPVPTPADFSRCPEAAAIWGQSFREGAPNAKGQHPLGDAIVAVTGYKGFVKDKDESRRITIRGCGYEQRTASITLGQHVEVANESKDFWTPVLEPGGNRVMRMVPPKGDPIPLFPKKAGRYMILDRDYRHVVVDLFVFLHPLHTVTNLEGHYRLDGIPVGKVKVGTMHPRFDGETTVDLDVKPGVVNHVDLVLKHVHKDAGPAVLGDAAVPVVPLR
jgi:hypothetical protein